MLVSLAMVAICLKIVALVWFVLGAAGVPSRVNLVSLGLAFWLLATLLGG